MSKYTKLVNGVRRDMTPEEIALRKAEEKEVNRKRKAKQTEKYRYDRKKAYLSIGDQLDALLKQFKHMEVNLVSEMQDIISDWESVKKKYPKPKKQRK